MQGMFYDLYNYFLKVERSTSAQPEVDMIIFNGTMPDRIQISSLPCKYNNTMSWGLSWAGDPAFPETEDRALAKELYKKWLYHEEIGEIMALSALYGAHSYAISRGIKFMWNMPKLALPPQLKETTCASLAGTEIPALWSYDFSNAGIVAYNRKYLCPDYHANNLGHSEYYKREILPRMSRYYTRGD
jgi:hypothetical protein